MMLTQADRVLGADRMLHDLRPVPSAEWSATRTRCNHPSGSGTNPVVTVCLVRQSDHGVVLRSWSAVPTASSDGD